MIQPATGSGETVAETRPLTVAETFLSLQGEGRHAGRVCAFIRLHGCNLACAWCDTPYTWQPGQVDPARRRGETVASLLAWVAATGAGLVEVTGGEPLLQPACPALLTSLCERGYEVLLDTSGSLSLDGVDPRVQLHLDIKCPGSGMTDKMVWTNLDRLRPGDEVKFVIADRADYEFARETTAAHRLIDRCRVVFTPVTPVRLELAEWTLARELAAWMIADGSPATLQVQLHRILWPAALRGDEEGYL